MAENDRQQAPRPVAASRWRYRVGRERGAIGRFADALEQDLIAAGIAESVRQTLATVLDELLANVIMHAQSARGPVHVHLRRRKDELIVRLRYCAAAFDPTAIAAAQFFLAAPGPAPAIGGDQFLQGGVEGIGTGRRLVDIGVAQHLAADLHAFIVQFLVHGRSLQRQE